MDFQQLKQQFEAHRSPDALPMAKYMKNRFSFLGIKTPQRRKITNPLFKGQKELDWDFVKQCWQADEREYQYAACDYLLRLKKRLTLADLSKIKKLVLNKSWWDTVDNLAKLITTLYLQYPPEISQEMLAWSQADNFWLRRCAIDFQLLLKEKTDTQLLKTILENNLPDDEFFINKAIGWALRDYSKTNPQWVKNFIQTHSQLSPLSVREGSKYL
ncbi:DNA alkylation repair protein [Lactobacillus corticis]|uniref:DNA-7-methylguanine glycosylase n=1 Tax=Lactobacillus corticis TaxID=2201249 RepID=A0A916QJJ2_9LACO|nr:DNA alkylation repair protein [Lactobacillus corticis]GFZ26907.1 DNA-7-methylguanine glycosylase [Lactobacillus corticis]